MEVEFKEEATKKKAQKPIETDQAIETKGNGITESSKKRRKEKVKKIEKK